MKVSFRKLVAFIDVFRRGAMVADPVTWKNRGAFVMAVAALIMALVKLAEAYGYKIPIDDDTAVLLAGGIAALVGVLSTYATSARVGLLPPKRGPVEGEGPIAPQSQPDERP